MHVRMGNELSSERSVSGGSPQGTKLGNFLFCATLEGIEDGQSNTIDEFEFGNTLESVAFQYSVIALINYIIIER